MANSRCYCGVSVRVHTRSGIVLVAKPQLNDRIHLYMATHITVYGGKRMNIFTLERDSTGRPCPYRSAESQCDKHIPKMFLEAYQMIGSALRRHGAADEDMPLTQKGHPLKGGYHNHPCTRWAGDSQDNFVWLCEHAFALHTEFNFRFGKDHYCFDGLMQMWDMSWFIPAGPLTQHPQAMPEQYRIPDDSVRAYRRYYINDKARFAKWERGRQAPIWFRSTTR